VQHDTEGRRKTTEYLCLYSSGSAQHIERTDAQKEEDRDEGELVKAVKPLLQQAETILNETNGAIRGADPDNRLTNEAKRNMQDHKATPEEQRLAEALKVVSRPLVSL
jgi:hypothetical protein